MTVKQGYSWEKKRMVKFYESELGEAIKARLTQLETKPKVEAKVPARRIIEQFRDAARQAMAKGYTLEEIRQIAQEAGLEVSVSTLKTYLRGRKVKKKGPEGKHKVIQQPAAGESNPAEMVTPTIPE